MQVVSEAKDNFRKDDDVRWQPSGARSTAKGSPQGERGGVHQFGVPPKGNANFAWVQHFIHHLAPKEVVGIAMGKKQKKRALVSTSMELRQEVAKFLQAVIRLH